MARPFKGTINLDIRDSKPDWHAFLATKAPKDTPNVLVILYDDTGCAAWSPYGGRINMPTMDRLAKNGLTYSQWHTTSVCSPTRSCFLTGHNHHQNGFGTIAESAAGFPGYAGHIPPENATIATVLRDAGWSTFWVGKNHNVPVDAFDIGANRKYWPLGLGYDRFYGFGVKQTPLAGVSMRYSFDNADAPTTKETQYYEMLSTRGIWHKGWKAAAEHGGLTDKGHFDQDRWQLFHTDVDRAEAHDLADQHPEKVKELAALWLAEAKKNNVLPLCDYGVVGIHSLEYKVAPPADGRHVYYPGTAEVPAASAARTLGVSFEILAEVAFTDDSQGVIVSQGSRFGGYTMFVKNGQLNFIDNFLGIPPEQKLSVPAPKSGTHIVGVEFKKASVSKTLETLGKMTLYVDEQAVGSADFRTQSGHYALAGEGLAVGYDSGDAVSKEYQGKFPFTGGQVIKVIYDIADDVYVDMERELAAVLARD